MSDLFDPANLQTRDEGPGVLTVSQFWLLANYVFNPREAKRIFPILAAGAIAGGITGGYLTRFTVKLVGGTANLAFFCIAFLAITIVLMNFAWRRRERAQTETRRGGRDWRPILRRERISSCRTRWSWPDRLRLWG